MSLSISTPGATSINSSATLLPPLPPPLLSVVPLLVPLLVLPPWAPLADGCW